MKKTLLIAAAALAAGVISSQAQSSVYSQNIVGYANVVTPTAGNNYCVSVPFQVGVSNGANEVFGTSLQGAAAFTQILIWNPNTAQYTTYQSDPSSPSGWDDYNYNPIAAPILPVGVGFFMIPSAAVTNTFVGTVAVASGASVTNSFATAGDNYLVGSIVPFAGSVTNASGLNFNLAASADYTQVLQWNPLTASYTTYQTDHTSPTGWDDYNYNPITPPNFNVGDGFFVVPSAGNVQWVQTLQ